MHLTVTRFTAHGSCEEDRAEWMMLIVSGVSGGLQLHGECEHFIVLNVIRQAHTLSLDSDCEMKLSAQ